MKPTHYRAGEARRGLVRARAEARPAQDDPKAVFADLRRSFEEFKAAHAEQLDGVRKRFDDVVTTEKLERVNSAVGEMQSGLDRMNARLEAMASGEDGEDAEAELRDPRYRAAFGKWFRRGGDEDELQAAMKQGPMAKIATTTDDEGAILAPIEWDRTLTAELREVSPMRQLARQVTVGVRGITKNFPVGQPASGWVGEADARPETTTPTFKPLDFEAMELYANPAISQRMLDDSVIDIESWLAEEVSMEFSEQENTAFVTGDGVKKPHGLLDYVTGGASAARHPFGAIGLVNTGAAAAMTADGTIDLVYDLPSVYSRNAVYAANKQTYRALRKLKDNDGAYLWRPGLSEGQPATVLGYRAVELQDLPNPAADALVAVFGDFQRGYLIVDRIGVRILRDPYTSKPNVQFYTTKRVGGGVNDPKAFRVQKVAL